MYKACDFNDSTPVNAKIALMQEQLTSYWVGTYETGTSVPFGCDPAKVTPEFVIAAYYSLHLAGLERKWQIHFDNPVNFGAPRELIHNKLSLAGLQLRDAFYLDSETKHYQALRKLPGLQTVVMETSRTKLLNQVEDHLDKNANDNDYANAVSKMVMDGLRKVKDSGELRVMAHSLMNPNLVTQKPGPQTPLCNVVIGGRHLFDNDAHKALKISIYRLRNKHRAQKMRALDLYHNSENKNRELCNRLTLARPKEASVPIVLLEDEDDEEDVESSLSHSDDSTTTHSSESDSVKMVVEEPVVVAEKNDQPTLQQFLSLFPPITTVTLEQPREPQQAWTGVEPLHWDRAFGEPWINETDIFSTSSSSSSSNDDPWQPLDPIPLVFSESATTPNLWWNDTPL